MKSLKESLFDDNLVNKDIKFKNMYDLVCVHMQTPYVFNALYTKRLIHSLRYSKYANRGGLNKYWVYYGTDPEWRKGIPHDIEQICNIFIGVINNLNMSEANKENPDVVCNWVFSTAWLGSKDPLANVLRNKLQCLLLEYTKGSNSHNVYVDTEYKYKGEPNCVRIKLGKNNYKRGMPDYLELIFKKK